MNDAALKSRIRLELREVQARKLGATRFTETVATAVGLLGMELLNADPERFTKRVALAATYGDHVFVPPTDVNNIVRVLDMGTNAIAVSGVATSGGLCKITTSAVHGRSTNDIVTVSGIVGSVEANGTWKITVIDTSNFTLNGSVFAVTYSSGGLIFKEDADFTKILRTPDTEATNDQSTKYYIKDDNIWVDDPDFDYDIILLYRYMPSSITDIPSRFHFGIVAYGVMDLMLLPASDHKNFYGLKTTVEKNTNLWNLCLSQIRGNYALSKEGWNLSDVSRIKRYI